MAPIIKSACGSWAVEVNGKRLQCVHLLFWGKVDGCDWYDESRFPLTPYDDKRVRKQAAEIRATGEVVFVKSIAQYADGFKSSEPHCDENGNPVLINGFKRNKGYVAVFSVDKVSVTAGRLRFRIPHPVPVLDLQNAIVTQSKKAADTALKSQGRGP